MTAAWIIGVFIIPGRIGPIGRIEHNDASEL
jgi:hypothetical protein